MRARRRTLGLGALLALAGPATCVAACQDGPPPGAPPAPPRVVARDAAGAIAFEARLAGDACDATGAGAVPDRLRVHDGDGVLDVLDPEGVPLARIQFDAATARVHAASRQPVASLAREGDRITATSADGQPLGHVTGTDDLGLAAVAIAPGLPPAVRAHVACARLRRAAPSPRPSSP